MRIRISFPVLLMSLSASAALAGEQYVNSSGYAVSGYDVVSYFDLKQVPVGAQQPHAAKGDAKYVAEYNGAKWAFSSMDHLAAFEADPQKYVPQYDGHCAMGVASGGKYPGNPDLWRVVGGKLYLNVSKAAASAWNRDISGNLMKSESNWPGLEKYPASEIEIPEFNVSRAPLGQ